MPEKRKRNKPTKADSVRESTDYAETIGMLERMAALPASQNSRGYIVVSLPAAHTQGLDTLKL